MTSLVLSHIVASISELKKAPMQVLAHANNEPIAILNRNQPVFYCVPSKLFEALIDTLEDARLVEIVKQRANEKEIPVEWDDL
ncbi:MAG: type II toxin-antitoxin system Phd/YefM family antitoxin [Gammaproteobacteria bacterium]